jgi:hypothetical protein
MTWTKCSERMPDIGVRVLGVNATLARFGRSR